ncbi:PPC domain-containing DNA-binding protein [Cupriavidus agavae]|nr:PPC domain-containing DNA-binding protein [Cupriavidus agavae]
MTAFVAMQPARAQSQQTTSGGCNGMLRVPSENGNYANVKRYIQTPTGYLLVLRMGDNVLERLAVFAACEKIPSASLSAIGFAHVTFGFWDAGKQQFNPKTYRDVEMASVVGSLAWKEGKPSIHIHGVAGDSKFDTYGGHILAMEVGTGSLEVTVSVHGQRLDRAIDPRIGANVLQLSQE